MIFVRGARQLLSLSGPIPRRGAQLSELHILRDGALLIDGGRIVEAGLTRRIENLSAARRADVLDVSGKVVLPAFVDSSTCPLLPVPQTGGAAGAAAEARGDGTGSLDAAAAMRATAPSRLQAQGLRWSQLFAAHGTATVGVDSPPGDPRAARKALRAVRALRGKPLELVSTFVAAQEADDRESGGGIAELTGTLLPALARRGLASGVEVVCGERGYTALEARRILDAAAALGLTPKLRLPEASLPADTAFAAEGAASVRCSADLPEDELDLLAASQKVITLTPSLAYHREENSASPARRLMDRGAAVALASGFDGLTGPTLSMPAILWMACHRWAMTPAEALSAATVNGAAALGRGAQTGSLEPGKLADLAVFEAADYRDIVHHFGVNLCVLLMRAGRIIHRGPAALAPRYGVRRVAGADALLRTSPPRPAGAFGPGTR